MFIYFLYTQFTIMMNKLILLALILLITLILSGCTQSSICGDGICSSEETNPNSNYFCTSDCKPEISKTSVEKNWWEETYECTEDNCNTSCCGNICLRNGYKCCITKTPDEEHKEAAKACCESVEVHGSKLSIGYDPSDEICCTSEIGLGMTGPKWYGSTLAKCCGGQLLSYPYDPGTDYCCGEIFRADQPSICPSEESCTTTIKAFDSSSCRSFFDGISYDYACGEFGFISYGHC